LGVLLLLLLPASFSGAFSRLNCCRIPFQFTHHKSFFNSSSQQQLLLKSASFDSSNTKLTSDTSHPM
jgi:hypothetical protein